MHLKCATFHWFQLKTAEIPGIVRKLWLRISNTLQLLQYRSVAFLAIKREQILHQDGTWQSCFFFSKIKKYISCHNFKTSLYFYKQYYLNIFYCSPIKIMLSLRFTIDSVEIICVVLAQLTLTAQGDKCYRLIYARMVLGYFSVVCSFTLP